MQTINTVDYHTGGEPFRIVAQPPVTIAGEGVADRRARATCDPQVDGLRRLLCHEPRGHADMYGGFITPPDDPGAAFGVLFWHKDGFSTACGHGTIALAAWAIDTGRVARAASGPTDLVIDVPSGRVRARAHPDGSVDFLNVPSYLLARAVPVSTSRGPVTAEIAFGGAIYAHVRARDAGLAVVPEQSDELIAFGREVKRALDQTEHARHPTDERLSGIYGTILFDELGPAHQRNVTVFADGQLDRSPCGSGSSSRVAALVARGELALGEPLIHDSIVGSRFRCVALEQTGAGLLTQVTGSAYRTGSCEFVVDPRDPLVPGFVLR